MLINRCDPRQVNVEFGYMFSVHLMIEKNLDYIVIGQARYAPHYNQRN